MQARSLRTRSCGRKAVASWIVAPESFIGLLHLASRTALATRERCLSDAAFAWEEQMLRHCCHRFWVVTGNIVRVRRSTLVMNSRSEGKLQRIRSML